MMPQTSAILDALRTNLSEIDQQIESMKKRLEGQIKVLPYPDGIPVYAMVDSDGKHPLVPLLAAKAQILSAMAALKAADMQQRAKR